MLKGREEEGKKDFDPVKKAEPKDSSRVQRNVSIVSPNFPLLQKGGKRSKEGVFFLLDSL